MFISSALKISFSLDSIIIKRRSSIPFKNSYSNKLFKSDPPEFSSKGGFLNTPKEGFLLPSFNWRWAGDWFVHDGTTQNQVEFYN